MPDDILYIGLDAGGSKTELLARCPDADDLTLTGPAANLQRLGLDKAVEVLTGLVRQGCTGRATFQRLSLCAGVAGASTLEDRAALERRLQANLADFDLVRVRVVHDAEIALEATFEGESGIVVIAGTGSVAFARTRDGALERIGGWGYLLGDEGSGHAVGLAGLHAVTAALDGGPATRLQQTLAEQYNLSTRGEILRAVYREAWPVQQMAPLVVHAAEAGDAVAARLLREQAHLLAVQVRRLRDRCPPITPQLALLGGLTRSPTYREMLGQALLEQLPGWTIREPAHRPVVGALRLAMSKEEERVSG